jgi:hypothetical protein
METVANARDDDSIGHCSISPAYGQRRHKDDQGTLCAFCRGQQARIARLSTWELPGPPGEAGSSPPSSLPLSSLSSPPLRFLPASSPCGVPALMSPLPLPPSLLPPSTLPPSELSETPSALPATGRGGPGCAAVLGSEWQERGCSRSSRSSSLPLSSAHAPVWSAQDTCHFMQPNLRSCDYEPHGYLVTGAH